MAVLRAEGRETRGQGNANATITATLTPDGEGTAVAIVTDLTITGRVAQFGRGVLADVSAKLLDQFVADLEKTVLVDEHRPERAGRGRGGRARGPDRGDAAGRRGAGRAADGRSGAELEARRGAPVVRPSAAVRKIDSPEPSPSTCSTPPARRWPSASARPRRHRGALDPQEAADPQEGLTRGGRRGRPSSPSRRCSAGPSKATSRSSSATTTALRSSSATRRSCATARPMPTRYWLVGEPERTWISRLEAAGGVNRAEAEVDAGRRWPTPTPATPPSATPRSRRTTTAPAPAVASAAPARGSSASTPTTPGTSPAATTPSAAGSRQHLDEAG